MNSTELTCPHKHPTIIPVMKVSKLIKKLQKIYDKHGDLKVGTPDCSPDEGYIYEIQSATMNMIGFDADTPVVLLSLDGKYEPLDPEYED